MSDGDLPVVAQGGALFLGRRWITLPQGRFQVDFFRDQVRRRTAMALSLGDVTTRRPLVCRVHSSCITSECLMACDCDCAEQLGQSFDRVAESGRGVVFYLMQEGRGAGLTAKARDRMMVQASGHRLTTFDAFAEMGLPSDLRRYDLLAPMVRALRIRGPVVLLTNNPDKAEQVSRTLSREKVDLVETRAIQVSTSGFNRDYMRAKRHSGHLLRSEASGTAELPPRTPDVEPALRAAFRPHLISTANYYLPVDLGELRHPTGNTAGESRVDWFRMRVIYDRRSARESVLLSPALPSKANGDDSDGAHRGSQVADAAEAEVERDGGDAHAITLSLTDRLPGPQASGRRALKQVLFELKRRACGQVIVHFDDADPQADREMASDSKSLSNLSREMLTARWVSAERENAEAGDVER